MANTSTSAPLDLRDDKDIAFINRIYLAGPAVIDNVLTYVSPHNFCQALFSRVDPEHVARIRDIGNKKFLSLYKDYEVIALSSVIAIETHINKDSGLYADLMKDYGWISSEYSIVASMGDHSLYAHEKQERKLTIKSPVPMLTEDLAHLPEGHGIVFTPLLCLNTKFLVHARIGKGAL